MKLFADTLMTIVFSNSSYLRLLTVLSLFLLAGSPAKADSEQTSRNSAQHTVIIYGATPGGLAAAIAATDMGMQAYVIEPTGHIGGMMTSGLGGTDHCNRRIIGGLARTFFTLNGDEYGRPIEWRVEPRVAEKIFEKMIADKNIVVLKNTRITGVQIEQARIRSVMTSQSKSLKGDIFIDASYEGDLMAMTPVSYVIGREERVEFNEKHAGVHKIIPRRQTTVPVPGKDSAGNLLPGLSRAALQPIGTGDKKIMAYNYRLCLTKNKDNRIPIDAPANYTPERFALWHSLFHTQPTTALSEILLFLPIPGEKFDLNANGPLSTDLIGENWDYPDGNTETREKIVQAHKDYTRGLLYFLANDRKVPGHIRSEMRRYGLCKDEFVDNNHWPYQLYIREARRMRGAYVLREADLMASAYKEDSIGLASCPVESHHVQGTVDANGFAIFEGWATEIVTPYQIPYRSIVPRPEQLLNLIVPVALSATHVAYSSLRMEPTFMILGESAGIAAALATRSSVAVQDIPIKRLQGLLKSRKQVLISKKGLKAHLKRTT